MIRYRFGLFVILVCGAMAIACATQVWVWGLVIGDLDARQEAIDNNILVLRNVVFAVLSLEGSQRGYLLTRDERYLAGYAGMARGLGPALAQLNALGRAEPALSGHIEEIAGLARQRRDYAETLIAMGKHGDFTAAIELVRGGEGTRIMDEVRDKSEILVEQLRQVRREHMQHQTRLFWSASVLGGTGTALILLLVSVAVSSLNGSVRQLDTLQKQREREAMHDPLTQLPNRRYLTEMLGRSLAAARRNGTGLVLLFIDLDRFKAVNDRLGHEAGDRVLRVTAARLLAAMRASDFVARIGGDEFVAVLPDAPEERELAMLVSRLREDLATAPIAEMCGGEIGASIGVASYPADGETADALLAAADEAMYRAKERQRRDVSPARPQREPLAAVGGG